MFRYLFIAAALIVLAGCASVQPPKAQVPWQTQQAQLAKIKSWQINGQIALITPKERHSASLYWQHQRSSDNLLLNGPFGKQLLSATITPQRTVVVVNDKTYQGPDSNQLISQLTGWHLPLNRLPFWLVGLADGAPYQLNTHQRIGSIKSLDGWQITYKNYQQVGQYVLPQQLEAKHGTARIKIIIDQWHVDPPHE
ncbi:lipoprotein insertase outer membrane protein LolB [Celerinatantimonas yamalensis]|uniref:Outer-membrane lipoprotein LolB n=1 Tax=Celerinatantimonas yamalensis TaxID=559956 RepID=A0ABW9G944_9GAMM